MIDGKFVALDPLRQASGKIVHAFAIEADVEPTVIISNTFFLDQLQHLVGEESARR